MASKHRIKRGEDYRRIVRNGNRVGGKYCLAHAVLLSTAANAEPARFGFIITKAVGNAVTRNLVRRRLQAICTKAVQQGFTNVDVVFRVFPPAANASYSQLEAAVLKQLAKISELMYES